MVSSLVTVVIPVYNVEKYLKECVDSVLQQTYKELEIILIDDGSTDNSSILCDEYAEQYSAIRVLHKNNAGLSSARNVGIKEANGEYIYFLDSDDYIDKRSIEVLVSEMKTSKADFISFEAEAFSDGIEIQQKTKYHKRFLYAESSGCDMLNQLIDCKEYVASVPLLFFKMEYLKKQKLFFENGLIHEDELFTFFAYMKANITKHYPVILYHRRMRENSIVTSPRGEKNYISLRKICKIIEQYCQSDVCVNKLVGEKYLAEKEKSVLWLYHHLGKKERKGLSEDFNKFRKNVLIHHGYGNKVLYLRAKNWYVGMLYSVIQKAIGR